MLSQRGFQENGFKFGTCVQRPPLGPEKRGHYAEVYMKKISGE